MNSSRLHKNYIKFFNRENSLNIFKKIISFYIRHLRRYGVFMMYMFGPAVLAADLSVIVN